MTLTERISSALQHLVILSIVCLCLVLISSKTIKQAEAAEFNKLLQATQNTARAVNPEAVTTTEHAGSDYLTQNTDGYLIQNPLWVQDDFFKPFKVIDGYYLKDDIILPVK